MKKATPAAYSFCFYILTLLYMDFIQYSAIITSNSHILFFAPFAPLSLKSRQRSVSLTEHLGCGEMHTD